MRAFTVLALVILTGCSPNDDVSVESVTLGGTTIDGSFIPNRQTIRDIRRLNQFANRRETVHHFVVPNYSALEQDISAGGGPALDHAMDLARIHQRERSNVRRQLRDAYFKGEVSPDSLSTALGVYGN